MTMASLLRGGFLRGGMRRSWCQHQFLKGGSGAGGLLVGQSSAARCRGLVSRSSVLSEQQKKKDGAAAATTTPLGIPYNKLTVGIPTETFPLERRVAATPETVQRLIKPGFAVHIQAGAGAASYFTDADYAAAGATIVDNVWKTSDIVLKVP